MDIACLFSLKKKTKWDVRWLPLPRRRLQPVSRSRWLVLIFFEDPIRPDWYHDPYVEEIDRRKPIVPRDHGEDSLHVVVVIAVDVSIGSKHDRWWDCLHLESVHHSHPYFVKRSRCQGCYSPRWSKGLGDSSKARTTERGYHQTIHRILFCFFILVTSTFLWVFRRLLGFENVD